MIVDDPVQWGYMCTCIGAPCEDTVSSTEAFWCPQKAVCSTWVQTWYMESISHIKISAFFSLLPWPSSHPLNKQTHTSPYQEVAVGERSRGGRLLEEPKMMLFRGNTFSLQVSIQDVPQFLWSIKPFTTCQVTMAAADKMSPYKKDTKSAKS